VRLSILDQSPIVTGRTPASAIRETVDLARLCDSLGYARYWVSEHHNTPSIAGSAPEVLLGALAMVTRRIRLGSAGIMLPHYAPLKVAEQFRVLEALAPGRIDLGLGRAPGSDQRTAQALNPQASIAAEHFPASVRDVMTWVSGGALPEMHPFAALQAQPLGPTAPEVWVLGSSDYGARLAAYFGLPYCFAHFFSDGRGAAEALATYHREYRPSAAWPEPHAALCVWAVAADTAEEARRLSTSRQYWRIIRDRGQYVPIPTPEEAAAFPYTESEQARLRQMQETMIAGTGPDVVTQLEALATRLGAAEIAIVTATHDSDARRHSYTLIAEAAGLSAETSQSG
jgi:luciferase family oxidoreductase group 1